MSINFIESAGSKIIKNQLLYLLSGQLLRIQAMVFLRLFERVMPPVFQGIPPIGIFDVTIWFLRCMPGNIGIHFLHMLVIGIGQIRLFLSLDFDNLSTAFMTNRFSVTAVLTHGF